MLSTDFSNLPKIRQTLFIVEKNRKYLFDVNQNITIYNLKRMIRVAANLDKGLRIFHEDVEYTDKDINTLEELFPNKQLIEFTLQIDKIEVQEINDLITIKLKPFCKDHYGKYANYYCYACGQSICADCLRDNTHNSHNYKEKYDYLDSGKNLIEGLFKDLNELLKNIKETPEDLINGLKAKITINFFPKLVEIVKQIEQNIINIVLFYLDKEKENYKVIQNNFVSLKNSCSNGIEKIKEIIEIEDIMIDDNIFLTFDKKINSIENEKEKIKKDLANFINFENNLTIITEIVEKTYREIYDYLIKYLEITKFSDIRTKISNDKIQKINEKEIIEIILKDIKKNEGETKFIEILKNVRKIGIKENENEKEKELKEKNQENNGKQEDDVVPF